MGILRLLLAVAVAIDHSGGIAGSPFITSTLPVQAFFLISGFYMSLILNEKYNDFSLFISNRLLRLFPLYWLFLVLTFIFSFPPRDGFLNVLGEMNSGFSFLTLFSNLFIVGQDIFYFLGLDLTTKEVFFASNFRTIAAPAFLLLPLRQTWSVGLEIYFYLVSPFIFKKSLKIALIVFFASFCIRILCLVLGYNIDPWNYRFFPNELGIFVSGYFSYRLYRSDLFKRLNTFRNHKIAGVAILGLTMSVGSIFEYQPALVSIFYLAILGITIPFIFEATKNLKWDHFIGELSYPIYLSHLLTLPFVAFYFKSLQPSYLTITNVFISILVSVFSVLLISMPIDKIRQKRVKNNK